MDVAGHHSMKKVCLPMGSKYNYEFVSEVASFSPDDTHKHDDQTDVMIDALDYAFLTPHKKVTSSPVLPTRRRR